MPDVDPEQFEDALGPEPADEEPPAPTIEAARFRQVLVVTHDVEIKEQLPNAIEVVKLPGRRATARLIGG